MNLYDLKQELNQLKKYLNFYINKWEEEESRMTTIKTSNIEVERVQGGKPDNKLDRFIENKDKFYEKIKEIEAEINSYTPLIKELEAVLKEFNDIHQQMYFDYYIKGYSADKIGMKHCYSRRQVYNIINRIDEDLQSKTLHGIARRVC